MRALWGALLWSLFLLLALRLHGEEEKKRLAEYKGLCRLVQHVKSALLQAPLPLCDVYERFFDDALGRAVFLPLLREKGLSAALSSGVLSLDREELLPFKEYAEALGTRLYTEELRETEALLQAAKQTAEAKETALPVRRRLGGTLFFSGGMLILLLIL